MALLDNLPNIFATQEPDYLKGLLGDKYPALQNQSTKSGLINAALTYLTTPKNQNLGTANILARTYLGGMQGAQGVYDTRAKNLVDSLNIAKTTKQIEMEGMTELDKLIMQRNKLAEADPNNPNIARYDSAITQKSGKYEGMTELDKLVTNRKKLEETDPNSPYLSVYDQAIAQKGGLYGSSVEGVSYNVLLRGNDGSPEAEARRATTAYAVAYRDSFAPKTVVQTVQDPVTGVTKQVPVQIQQAPPPPNILPPIYGSGVTTKTTATTAPSTTGTGGNVTSAPTALTPQLYKQYSDKIDQSTKLNLTLSALKDDINANGMQLFGLGEKGAYQASLYENALTQIRIAAELGVLNIQDLPRLMKSLPNPTDLSSYIKGGGSSSAVLGALKQVEDQNTRDIKFYENKINPPSAKPAKAGGGVMLDLDAITKELKRRKGGK